MYKYSSVFLSLFFLQSCYYLPETPNFSKTLSNISEAIAPIVHKNSVNQGSVIRQEKLDLINIGMTKKEIVSIIGSPSINDPFHSNQWDYIHHSKLTDNSILNFRVTLFFNNQKLEKIDTKKFENISKVEKYNLDLKSISKREEDIENKKSQWYKFW